MMKMFDRFVNKSVVASSAIQSLADAIKQVAISVEKLTMHFSIVSQNQDIHHRLISQMWQVQQILLQKLNERSMDMAFPEIEKVDKKVEPS